jgi:hypothetical protein
MVFRCELDGSKVELLAWNFRNNWEVAVDSFGRIWQSDNDDDGNKGVRINFVMEFGNYGYKDEMTGAGWQTPRLGMESDIPLRHWHQNDPGVVPNLLQTGAGSPTGMQVYEGDLLPSRGSRFTATPAPMSSAPTSRSLTAPASRPRASISLKARRIVGSGPAMCAWHRTGPSSWPTGTIRASAVMGWAIPAGGGCIA